MAGIHFNEHITYQWEEMFNRGVAPSIRCNTEAINYDGALWVILGAGPSVGRSTEVWRFDLSTCRWEIQSCKGEIPAARDGHSVTYLGHGKVIIFGGQGVPYLNDGKSEKITETMKIKTYFVREVLNNLYQLDLNTLSWTTVEIDGAAMPMPRRSHISMMAHLSFSHLGYSKADIDLIHRRANMPEYQHLISICNPEQTTTTNGRGHGGHHGSHNHNGQEQQHTAFGHAIVELKPSLNPNYHDISSGYRGNGNHNSSNSSSAASGDQENISKEKVLIVFGGCGIEPSKYTEVIFNDTWAFSLVLGRWIRLNPVGIHPRPVFDHRAVMVGSHTLVVVGGVTGHDSPNHRMKAGIVSLGINTTASDVMLLDTNTLTWSYQPVIDQFNRPARLALHGHSLVSDWTEGTNTSGTIYIFGGKEVVDLKQPPTTPAELAGKRRKLPPPRHPIWKFELCSRGVLTPVDVEGALQPENRYGHVAIPNISVHTILKETAPNELRIQQRIAEEEAAAAAAARAATTGAVKAHHPWAHKRNVINLGANGPTDREDTIMYMFGGTSVEMSGFCDPIVYKLAKVHKFVDTFMSEIDMVGFVDKEESSAHLTEAVLQRDHGGVGGGKRSMMIRTARSDFDLSQKSTQSSYFGGRMETEPTRRMSIWERRKLQLRVENGPDVPIKNPETWEELKVCLSFPVHERKSQLDAPSGPTIRFADKRTHLALRRAQSAGAEGIHASPSFASYTSSKDGGAGGGSGTSSHVGESSISESDREHAERISALSKSLLPRVRGKSMVEVRKEFLRSNTPLYTLEKIDPFARAIQPHNTRTLKSYVREMASMSLVRGSTASGFQSRTML